MAPLRGVIGWFTLRCARPRTGVQYGVGLRAMRGQNLECVLYGGGRGFHADYFAGTNGAVDLSNCKWEKSCHLRCSTQRWNVSKLWCDGVRTSPAIAEDGTTRCSSESLTFDSLVGGLSLSCQGLFAAWKLIGGGISAAAGIPSERAVCGTAMFGGRIWAWLFMGSGSYFNTW
jgi:hypothetical protein